MLFIMFDKLDNVNANKSEQHNKCEIGEKIQNN
jgi:hypothetical protein